MNLITQLEEREKAFQRMQAENALLQRQIGECEDEILQLTEYASVVQTSQSFLEELANARRGDMKGRIESVITKALHVLYDENLRVEMVYGVKNNRSFMDIELVQTTPKGEVRRTMGGFGLGVADTISVPLRLMILVASGETDRVCVLDESYKHLSPEKVPLVGEFIRQITESLGVQVIMCSHHVDVRDFADINYKVEQSEGISMVEIT